MSVRAITIRHPDDVHVNSFKNIIFSVMFYEYLIMNIFEKLFTDGKLKHNIRLTDNDDNIRGGDILICSKEMPQLFHFVDCKMYNLRDNTIPITWNRLYDDRKITDSYAVIINDICYWVSRDRLKEYCRKDMFSYSEYTKSSHMIADYFKQIAHSIYELTEKEKRFLSSGKYVLGSIPDEENNFEHIYEIFDKFRDAYLKTSDNDVVLNIAP